MTASASRSVRRTLRSAVPGWRAFREYPSLPPEVVLACLDRPRPKYSSVGPVAGPQAERRIEKHQHDRGDQDPNGDVPRPGAHQTKQAILLIGCRRVLKSKRPKRPIARAAATTFARRLPIPPP